MKHIWLARHLEERSTAPTWLKCLEALSPSLAGKGGQGTFLHCIGGGTCLFAYPRSLPPDPLCFISHLSLHRYILPTSYSSYDLHSKCSGNGNDINYGILREEPFWSMIRINWNIIHAGKAENVTREKGSNYDHSSE